MLAISRNRCVCCVKGPQDFLSSRFISNSPYGRTHIWKRRPPSLPNPVVPKYTQKVIRSDGTSFTHWITSPKSLVRLTRDTTNNPHWNTGNIGDRLLEDESGSAGRMARFSRKFEELGSELDDSQWMEEMSSGVVKPQNEPIKKPTPKVAALKKT